MLRGSTTFHFTSSESDLHDLADHSTGLGRGPNFPSEGADNLIPLCLVLRLRE